jgi:glycosyltransferase involved in cell wall biosynthesis
VSAKKHVVIVSEIIAPYRIPVFNALAKDPRIDPHVIFLAETDPFLREWRVSREQIGFSYEVLSSWRRRVAGYNLLLSWGVERSLRKHSPDAIICGGYNYLAAWQAASWSEKNAVPFLLWSESTAADDRGDYPLVEFAKRRFIRKCRGGVAAGRSSFEYLADLIGSTEAIHTAPDAVDNEFFTTTASAVRAQADHYRRRYRLPARYFLCAGRLTRQKGVSDLLDAYAALAPDLRAEISLVFAGSGALRSDLERQASSIAPGRVHFTGFLAPADLAAVYSLAEMLVFPTHSDPWGLVVNEAMACSLPIIATAVAGCTADLVEHGKNGLVVSPRDVAQLSSAMDLLARNPQLRKDMGSHGAELIRRYSPEACAEGLAAAVSHTLGSSACG